MLRVIFQGEKIEAMKNAEAGEFGETNKTTGGPKRKGLRSGSINSLTPEDKMHMVRNRISIYIYIYTVYILLRHIYNIRVN